MTCSTCWLPPECSDTYCKSEHKAMTSPSNAYRHRPSDSDTTDEETP